MSKLNQLQQLYQELDDQAAKLPLANSASDFVPGEGNPDAEIMFIGEAPGYHESVEHRPFVGKSGKFFRQTLAESAQISEKDIYISNVVKVRPPDNRDPSPAEIKAYKPFLDKEIGLIQPAIIVTLGRFSMAKFLPEVKISQVHGRLHAVRWEGRRLFVLPTFHPAAALRNGRFRELFVQDLTKLPKVLAWVKDHESNFALADQVKATLL